MLNDPAPASPQGLQPSPECRLGQEQLSKCPESVISLSRWDPQLLARSSGWRPRARRERRQGIPLGQQLRGPHLPRILLTQPWLTRSCRDMSQGRTPWWASSTMRCLTTSGRGRPFTNTPPSWFTPPCPAGERQEKKNTTPHTQQGPAISQGPRPRTCEGSRQGREACSRSRGRTVAGRPQRGGPGLEPSDRWRRGSAGARQRAAKALGSDRWGRREKLKEGMETQGERKEGRRGGNSKGGVDASGRECKRKERPGRRRNLRGADPA